MLTFREFYEICEGKKPITPPHAVPGTFVRHSDGGSSYTLAPYEGPLGKPKKKEVKKLVVDRSGGKQVEKYVKRRDKEVREDIETRRIAARQQRSDQIASQRQDVANYHTTQQKQKQKASEREQLKQEIKKELQAEQHPVMEPNEYSKQVARQSARWKGMQIRQAHGEMEHQAGAELAAKKARLKSIMSR
jgi:hypothetical protein